MSGDDLFLDTNILIYLLKGNPEITELLNGKHFFISFITEIELLSFPVQTTQEASKIQSLLAECHLIDIYPDIKQLAVEIRKQYKLKLPDAIVCATSIYANLPILTADKNMAKVDKASIMLYQP